MIQYIKGDLLSSNERYIAHGCNAQGVMGAGIALAIKKKYPYAWKEYREKYADFVHGLSLGDVLPAEGKAGDPVIFNCVTQEYYGRAPNMRYVSYDAIDKCFRSISYTHSGITLGIPKIGCSLGGGSWPVVEAILNEITDLHFNVYEL